MKPEKNVVGYKRVKNYKKIPNLYRPDTIKGDLLAERYKWIVYWSNPHSGYFAIPSKAD